MSFSLKNLWLKTTTSFLALSGVIYADSQCIEQFTTLKNWVFTDDLLYWKTCGAGHMFGSESSQENFVASATFKDQETNIKSVHRRADVGYRFGLEYNDPCGCLSAAVIWTHFVNDAHGHYSKPQTLSSWFTPAFGAVTRNDLLLGGSFPVGIGATSFLVQQAKAHWKLRLNIIDAMLGREYCMNSCLTLKPLIGLRTGLIDQRFDVKYEAITIANGTEFPVSPGPSDQFSFKSDFEGVGPRIGLDTTYDLGCGISLYGNTAASLLWGMQEVQSKEKYVLTETGRPTTTATDKLKQKDHETGCRAVTDLAIGVRWKYCCCQRVLTIQIGYEQHLFFNENIFEKFTNFDATGNLATDRYPQVTRDNLCIHGLVASTSVVF